MAHDFKTIPIPNSNGQQEGDDVVFKWSSVVLCCGVLATSVAAFGCNNKVLALLAPELAWLVLVPALLIVLLGIIGVCSSGRSASTLFRLQFAVFLLVLSAMMAGAGCFSYISAGTFRHWLLRGCRSHRVLGTWRGAGRARHVLQRAHTDYLLLKSGWEACRSLNPLVCDLAKCGLRASLDDGREASEVALFAWFQHAQVTLACGGFCDSAVPLFGLSSVQEALVPRAACVPTAADYVQSWGHALSLIAGAFAMPVAVASLVLLCVEEGRSEHEYDVVSTESWSSEGEDLLAPQTQA